MFEKLAKKREIFRLKLVKKNLQFWILTWKKLAKNKKTWRNLKTCEKEKKLTGLQKKRETPFL